MLSRWNLSRTLSDLSTVDTFLEQAGDRIGAGLMNSALLHAFEAAAQVDKRHNASDAASGPAPAGGS
jgi:hypothetical protein